MPTLESDDSPGDNPDDMVHVLFPDLVYMPGAGLVTEYFEAWMPADIARQMGAVPVRAAAPTIHATRPPMRTNLPALHWPEDEAHITLSPTHSPTADPVILLPMNHYTLYALVYALTLAVVAGLSPFVGAPAGALAGYVVQAALLGIIAGAGMAWVLAGRSGLTQGIACGWVLLALVNGVGQGALAEAAASGAFWGVGVLVLLTLFGRR